ncbi:hypothetical protein KC19_2G067800 [Ceratodon purpureus]|uniref:Uncharacterized protein n=1 Tax=Ceratodon purpureus TaxID=3225 RepID=A0A8T0ISJ7_CERPU|nr:hypothetical protein KC19_2G067800 [Ceratodon purpureus]
MKLVILLLGTLPLFYGGTAITVERAGLSFSGRASQFFDYSCSAMRSWWIARFEGSLLHPDGEDH